ncbi:hypothetical protein [Geodermatophilus obscurus]|uniref:Camelysin metallo-endopeptidase n=1 Tax=Geodermatophilus obscurus (strain ATCC 25078 / DSM 43160 / JCM 3152 / CCUG 61914 / KCC A-0152 / KCTC 9177 / NBRC 13315 / NRRL B-3577 / G-20) TaxID=526225 RepID=D2S908_GEOOG|nr:hypothetical protein [Geodermatophilus obscurus]ADB73651.1 conserved hypothetical protein [Geodermatophilus obscurus DSM 43160]
MHHRARRARRTALSVAVPVGLVTSLALTWGSTHAAFSASTGNVGNSWQTGSVVLSHSASGSALFTSASDGALKPGSSRSRCIRVDYTGDLAADIRMYAGTPTSGATTLDPYLVMSVERGADVTASTTVAADCTGFTPTATPTFLYNTAQANASGADSSRTLAHLKATHPDYGNGVLVSAATAPNTHITLRISYTVKDDNAAQTTQSSATFTWEARNTP